MRPALTISARRARSSQCLLKHCCFEIENHKRSLFTLSAKSNNLPNMTHRPLLLWFLVNKPYSTQTLSPVPEARNLNHRLIGKNVDLPQLLSYIEMNSLSPKEIFKLLRVKLYQIDPHDAESAWMIYNTMMQYQVDKYLKTNHYGYLLGILKYGNNVPQMLTVLENIKESEEATLTSIHTSQVLFALSKQGLTKECCQLVQQMTEAESEELAPTASHYHSLAIALKNAPHNDPTIVEQAAQLMLDGMESRNITLDQSTLSIMLSLLSTRQYKKENLILDFLRAMDHRNTESTYNVYIYTSLIAGFARQGDSVSAKRIFEEMQKFKVKPNQVTYAAMMEAYGRAGDFTSARALLKEHHKRFKKLTNPLVTSLLVNAIRHNNFAVAENTAKLIKRKIKLQDQDTMLRTALLWLKAKTDVDIARKSFDSLYKRDPDMVSSIMVNHLIEGFGKKGNKARVLDTLQALKQRNARSQHYVANALFHCRDVSAALSIFGSMRANSIPDDITIAMVIQGLVMNNEGNLAWRLFKTLQSEGIEPNLHAYTSILKALGHRDTELKKRKIADIDDDVLTAAGIRARVDYINSPVPVTTEALNLFRHMTGFQQPNVYTYTTLISCFAKSNITQAIRIFDHMCSHHVQPTVETYTALLQGCAMFRNSQMALTIFNHMCDKQIKPNAVTWRYLLKSLLRGRVDRKEIDKIGDMARKALANQNV